MSLRLLTLAALAAPAAAGMVASMCSIFPMPVLCTAASQSAPGMPPGICTGNGCCAASGCYSVPGMGCRSSRGSTECVGAKMFPPTKGICKCLHGSCAASGQCAAPSAGWQRLYEVDEQQPLPVPPEDFMSVLAVMGVAACGLVAGSAVVVMRLRRPRGARGRVAAAPSEMHESLASGEDVAEE